MVYVYKQSVKFVVLYHEVNKFEELHRDVKVKKKYDSSEQKLRVSTG